MQVIADSRDEYQCRSKALLAVNDPWLVALVLIRDYDSPKKVLSTFGGYDIFEIIKQGLHVLVLP